MGSTGQSLRLPVTGDISPDPPDCDSRDEKQVAAYAGFDLAGRRVLCVGGRAALYPEYHRMVEASGGKLLIYRRRPAERRRSFACVARPCRYGGLPGRLRKPPYLFHCEALL